MEEEVWVHEFKEMCLFDDKDIDEQKGMYLFSRIIFSNLKRTRFIM